MKQQLHGKNFQFSKFQNKKRYPLLFQHTYLMQEIGHACANGLNLFTPSPFVSHHIIKGTNI